MKTDSWVNRKFLGARGKIRTYCAFLKFSVLLGTKKYSENPYYNLILNRLGLDSDWILDSDFYVG